MSICKSWPSSCLECCSHGAIHVSAFILSPPPPTFSERATRTQRDKPSLSCNSFHGVGTVDVLERVEFAFCAGASENVTNDVQNAHHQMGSSRFRTNPARSSHPRAASFGARLRYATQRGPLTRLHKTTTLCVHGSQTKAPLEPPQKESRMMLFGILGRVVVLHPVYSYWNNPPISVH